MRTYYFTFDPAGHVLVKVERNSSTRPLMVDRSRQYRKYSKTFGLEGHGSRQLALALLLDFFAKGESERALRLAPDFDECFVRGFLSLAMEEVAAGDREAEGPYTPQEILDQFLGDFRQYLLDDLRENVAERRRLNGGAA